MATKTQKPEGAAARSLCRSTSSVSSTRLGVPPTRAYAPRMAGGPGKAMTEDEFLAAVAKFNNSPMNGRKSKEARK